MNLPLALGAGVAAWFLATKLGVLHSGPPVTGHPSEPTTTEGAASEGAKPDQGGRAQSTVTVTKTTVATPNRPVTQVKVTAPAAKPVAKPASTAVAGSKPLTQVFQAPAAPKKVQASEAQKTVVAAIRGMAPGLVV